MHKDNSRHNSIPAEPSPEEIARLTYSFFETEGRARWPRSGILVASQGAIVKRSARPGTSLNETRGSKARQPVVMQKIGRGAPDQHQRQGVQK